MLIDLWLIYRVDNHSYQAAYSIFGLVSSKVPTAKIQISDNLSRHFQSPYHLILYNDKAAKLSTSLIVTTTTFPSTAATKSVNVLDNGYNFHQAISDGITCQGYTTFTFLQPGHYFDT